MPRPPLTSEERDVLAGRQKQAGFTLRDRLVAAESLGPWAVADIAFEDVDFEDVTFSDASFERCVFRTCSFARTVFRGVRLTEVAFEACRFADCTWVSVEARSCRLQGAVIAEWRLVRSALRAWDIEGLSARGVELEKSELSACRFSACDLGVVRLEDCVLADVTCSGGALENLKCGYSTLTAVRLSAVRVDGIEILGGRAAGVVLEGVSGGDVLFAALELDGLRLSACHGLAFVRLTGVSASRIAIEGCDGLAAFMLHDCRLGSLTVRDSAFVELGLSAVHAPGPSSFERCRVAEWSFDGGSFGQLSVVATRLEDVFRASGTRFAGLCLDGVHAGSDTDLRVEGVVYDGGSQRWEDTPRAD